MKDFTRADSTQTADGFQLRRAEEPHGLESAGLAGDAGGGAAVNFRARWDATWQPQEINRGKPIKADTGVQPDTHEDGAESGWGFALQENRGTKRSIISAQPL